MTLSLTINETLKWLSSLPIVKRESLWWWECSDRYIISLFLSPHLHIYPHPPFPPSLISRMVSVDIKHHVYLLTAAQWREGTAQPAERLDWKAKEQYWRGFQSLVRQGTFLPESAFSADSLMVSAQPPRAIAYINICAHVKNPTHWQSYHCLNTGKYCTHWQERVALLLRLLCVTRVRRPKFSARGNEIYFLLSLLRCNVALGTFEALAKSKSAVTN